MKELITELLVLYSRKKIYKREIQLKKRSNILVK